MVSNLNEVQTQRQKDNYIKPILKNLVELVETAKFEGLIKNIIISNYDGKYLTLLPEGKLVENNYKGKLLNIIEPKDYFSIVEKYNLKSDYLILTKNNLLKE